MNAHPDWTKGVETESPERLGAGPQRPAKEVPHGTAPLAIRPDHHPEIAPRYYAIHGCRPSRDWSVFETEAEATANLASKPGCGGQGCLVAVEVVR